MPRLKNQVGSHNKGTPTSIPSANPALNTSSTTSPEAMPADHIPKPLEDTRLLDPERLGEGKLRRHIKLTSIPDIAQKHVGEYRILALKASLKP